MEPHKNQNGGMNNMLNSPKNSENYKTYGKKAITFLYILGFSTTFISQLDLFGKHKADVTL